MTPLLATALIVHVLAGILAISFLFVIAIHLLKREPNFNFLSWLSWSTVVLFLLSWGSSAYYYVTYYGGAVKPRILEGDFPAGHIFFMEAKEHLFLLLPFLTIALAFTISLLRHMPDERVKKAAAFLAVLALCIGIFITAAGMVVSGSI